MSVKITFNRAAFQQIRRLPEVDAELNRQVDKVLERLDVPGYMGGVERGRTRSRGFVVTADWEAIRDNSENHSLLRAAGGG